MDSYTITNIDPTTNLVSVNYVYKSHALSDLVPVTSVTDPTAITTAVVAAYDKFKSDMDTLDSQPALPTDVQALIGQTQQVS